MSKRTKIEVDENGASITVSKLIDGEHPIEIEYSQDIPPEEGPPPYLILEYFNDIQENFDEVDEALHDVLSNEESDMDQESPGSS